MSTTFKSWLIANFETATGIILAVIITPVFLIFIANTETPAESTNVFFWIFFLAVIIPFSLGSSPPSLTKNIFAYLVILAIFCIFPFFGDDSETGKLLFPVWGAILSIATFTGVSVAAFFIARYANSNFDEVVSRRMLYRNSNVNLFSIEWRYTLDRFCISAFCLIDVIFAIAFLFAMIFGMGGATEVNGN
jgi:hypothetical protein